LEINISKAGINNTAQIINEGFWGINVIANENYLLNFYLRTNNYTGSVTAILQDENNSVLATVIIPHKKGSSWQKYTATLTPKKIGRKSKFVLSFNIPALFGWILFPCFHSIHLKTGQWFKNGHCKIYC
jgi:hypothetical protein